MRRRQKNFCDNKFYNLLKTDWPYERNTETANCRELLLRLVGRGGPVERENEAQVLAQTADESRAKCRQQWDERDTSAEQSCQGGQGPAERCHVQRYGNKKRFTAKVAVRIASQMEHEQPSAIATSARLPQERFREDRSPHGHWLSRHN